MDHPERPDNFTGVWVERYGLNARTEQQYVNGVANGRHRSVLENGVIHREGFKQDGRWHGAMIVRNAHGEVLDSSEFVEGTGIYRIFNTAGQMTDEVPMVRGKRHGVVRCWRSGKLITTCYYVNGVCEAAVCEACPPTGV